MAQDPGLRAQGIIALRVQATFAPRSAAHVVMGLRLARRGNKKKWAVATAAALASDVAMQRWLRRDGRWRMATRTTWDTIDAALWSWATRFEPAAGLPRQIMLGDVAPHAIEAAVRLGAGTEARPLIHGAVPLPLTSPRAAAALVGRGAVASLGSWTAMRVVRHRWGSRDWPAGENLWPLASFFMALPLARIRHFLQARGVREWETRAGTTARRQAGELRLALAAHPSVGHDFPKVLQILGFFGSDEARSAGVAGLRRPADLAPSPVGRGRLLGQLVNRADLDPPELGLTWVSGDDVPRLRAFLDLPEVQADRGQVAVRRPGDGSVSLHVAGRSLVLRPPLHRIRTSLDPIEAVSVVAAYWKLVVLVPSWGPTRGDAWMPTLAAGLDGLGAWEHRRRNPDGIAPTPRSIHLSLLSLAVMAIRDALDRQPRWAAPGIPLCPSTMSACGTLGVLGTWWDDLDSRRWGYLAAVLALFGLGVTRAGRRRDAELWWELVALWQVFGSAKGLSRVASAEGEIVGQHLVERYHDRLAQDGASVVQAQMEVYRTQLAVARRALTELRPEMPDDVHAEVTQRCDDLERWLDDPATLVKVDALVARTLDLPAGGLAER